MNRLLICLLLIATPAFAGTGALTITPGSGASIVTTTDGSGNNLSHVVTCDSAAGASCQTIKGASTPPVPTDNAQVVATRPNASTYIEDTITSGGTAQNICGGITPTSGFEIINNSTSEVLYFRENSAAAVAGASSIPIQANATSTAVATYKSPMGYTPKGPISVIATTTAHPLIERCY